MRCVAGCVVPAAESRVRSADGCDVVSDPAKVRGGEGRARGEWNVGAHTLTLTPVCHVVRAVCLSSPVAACVLSALLPVRHMLWC